MARKARREITSGTGFYHVYSRGNRKQEIFRSDIDHKHFLKLMGELAKKHGVEIHCFCLMPNHFHMLIRSGASEMAKFFQQLLSIYTIRTNKIYDEVGHLFQGRYHSKPVEHDTYALEVSRYIHNNPIDLGIASVEKYQWSSMAGYLYPKQRNTFLYTEFILGYFDNPSKYLRFVNDIQINKTFVHWGQSNIALSPEDK